MGFIEALVVTVLGFILTEAPNVKKNEALTADFKADITSTVDMHVDTVMKAPIGWATLVDTRTDVLILSAITYRESRFRLPPPDGDCVTTHPLIKVPSRQWPSGYVPVLKRECRAIGPQQLNKGNTKHLPPWLEIQKLFPERDWGTAEGRKKDKLTEKQMRDPATNVRLSYGILVHWKNECRHKDGTDAPVGVWFTAYRYGRCPFHYKTDKYHIDTEAKTRCELIQKMADGFDSSVYALPQNYRCTYGEKREPGASAAVRLSSAR